MSASFYDLLKYAKTGIASPSMTYYDKLKALSMCKAGFPVKTLTGVPPLTFQSDGTPLTAWSIYGNMTQTGTPTPSAPIQPEECGERTGNLAPPYSEWVNGYIDSSTGGIAPQTASLKEKTSDFIEVEPSTSYTFSRFPEGTQGAWRVVGRYNENKEFISRSGGAGSTAIAFTTTADTKYVRVCCRTYGSTDNSMLNPGSTALPYEPFGYKIPISLAGQTQTIYLDEPLRKALDGSDAVDVLRSDGTLTRAVDSDGNALQTPTTETVTVPTLTPQKGSNTLSVGTTLQPSEISITGGIK